jgi:hypothetical protein
MWVWIIAHQLSQFLQQGGVMATQNASALVVAPNAGAGALVVAPNAGSSSASSSTNKNKIADLTV